MAKGAEAAESTSETRVKRQAQRGAPCVSSTKKDMKFVCCLDAWLGFSHG